VSKCSTIDGVVISAEELDALKEAANAQADAPEREEEIMPISKPKPSGLEEDMSRMNLNDKKKQISESLMQAKKVPEPIVPKIIEPNFAPV